MISVHQRLSQTGGRTTYRCKTALCSVFTETRHQLVYQYVSCGKLSRWYEINDYLLIAIYSLNITVAYVVPVASRAYHVLSELHMR